MKQITKQRILEALERNERHTSSKPEIHIIQTLAKVGLESAAARAFKDDRSPFTDRDRLELAYFGFSDPDKISKRLSDISINHGLDLNDDDTVKKVWLTLFQHTIQRSSDRHQHILEIQQRHCISGLEEVEVNFDGKAIKIHAPHDCLGLLVSDFHVMHSERMLIARTYVQAARSHKMLLYQYNSCCDEWSLVEPKIVLAYAFARIWAKAWTKDTYVNDDELHRNGYATVKHKPETKADKRSLEFHLLISNNCSLNSHYQLPDQSDADDWFCAKQDLE